MAVISPQFSFIQFDGDTDVLPVSHAGDIIFQVQSTDTITAVAKIGLDGSTIEQSTAGILQLGGLYQITPSFGTLQGCFRIALLSEDITIAVSSTIFSYTDSKYTAKLIFQNDEDSFGFIYCPNELFNSVRLPFYLREPQHAQKRTVYEKRDGRRKTLGAAISKEYSLETDYLSARLHEKLLVALSHDNVHIDGKLLTMVDDYTVDWASTLLDSRSEETAKAACKMSENITYRNSNCGDTCEDTTEFFDVQPHELVFEAA